MKLAGVQDGTVYCTRSREVGTWKPDAIYRPMGALPEPCGGSHRLRSTALRTRTVKRMLRPVVGAFATNCLFPLSGGPLLASVEGCLFRSTDGGDSWDLVHSLPEGSKPAGLLPTSVCEHDGAVYLAEYGLGEAPARILRSDDRGISWRVAVKRTDVRHFHSVCSDPYSGEVWATAGDADSESAIGVVTDGSFHPVGSGSQRWRAVDLAFTPDAVVWGMDCSYAPSVELLRLPRERIGDGSADPEPTVVGRVDSPVFFAETLSIDGEDWVVLTTAAESGVDSTAPPSLQQNASGRVARAIAAPVDGDMTAWRGLASFPRRRTIAERVPGISPASAYLYVAVHPEKGLILNPYNTRDHHGELLSVAADAFNWTEPVGRGVAGIAPG